MTFFFPPLDVDSVLKHSKAIWEVKNASYHFAFWKSCWVFLDWGIITSLPRSSIFLPKLPCWSGWWFQIFFIFTPIWGRFPNGLKPPTSDHWQTHGYSRLVDHQPPVTSRLVDLKVTRLPAPFGAFLPEARPCDVFGRWRCRNASIQDGGCSGSRDLAMGFLLRMLPENWAPTPPPNQDADSSSPPGWFVTLLVGNPKLNLSFVTVTGSGGRPKCFLSNPWVLLFLLFLLFLVVVAGGGSGWVMIVVHRPT